MTAANSPKGPSDFGPGHEHVNRIIRQALSLTESQAFALRKDRDTHKYSPAWLGIHAHATRELARHAPDAAAAWIAAAESSTEAAVWWVADSWGDKPLAARAVQSLHGMAAQDAATAAAYAAKRAALAAVTAHLVDGREGIVTPTQHATLSAAWRTVFPE